MARLDKAWRDVAAESAGWLSVAHDAGLEAVPAVWDDISLGAAPPSVGHVALVAD